MVIVLTLMLSLGLASSLFDPSDSPDLIKEINNTTKDISLDITGAGSGDNATVVRFFYAIGCPHCAIVEPFIDSMEEKYPQVTFLRLEISRNGTNWAAYRDLNARYNVSNPVVPSVFVGGEALVGEDAIQANLEPIILRLLTPSDDGPSDGPTNETNDTNVTNCTRNANGTCEAGPNGTMDQPDANSPDPSATDPSAGLTVAMVVVAAAADSINPCAISVMIFLLIFLTSLGNRRRVLMIGLVYIATVYAVYFMAGLGTMAFLQSTTMTRYVYYIAATLSIAIGLINIKDFFFNKKPTLAIPESKKPLIKKYVEKASIPAAVGLGVMVSLFELPCTGGIYFAILNMLGNSMTAAEGIPWLVLYNAIYVLPLAVILGIILVGVSADRANSWRLENRRWLRLALGLVMVLIGVMMFSGMM